MKILQITTHMNMGGIGNYILTLSGALKARGADIVAASSGGNLEPELAKLGIRHIRIDIRTKFEFGLKVFRAIPRICRLVREEKVDIIHAHTRVSQVVAFFVSKKTGVPYITTCHGFFRKRFRSIFDTWGVKVIAISDSVKKHLRRDLGVADSRIEIIYSGVDASRIERHYSEEERRAIKQSLGLKDYPVVGTIGRLSVIKGHKFLVQAMRDVLSKKSDVEVLIVGDGEEKILLKDLAQYLYLENSVHFIDSSIDTEKILAIIDVFVFPSLKEGLGIALLEALAAGKACVASGVGGIKDIITDGKDGILVGACDIIAIGDAILRLLNDPALRGKMGEAGRELVRRRFTLDAMADKVMGLYGKVARVKGQGSRVL